jgi:hypothetical protein
MLRTDIGFFLHSLHCDYICVSYFLFLYSAIWALTYETDSFALVVSGQKELRLSGQ